MPTRPRAPLMLTERRDIDDWCWPLLLPDGLEDRDVDRVALADLAWREPDAFCRLFPDVVERLIAGFRERAEGDLQSVSAAEVLRELFVPGRGRGRGRPQTDDPGVQAALVEHLVSTVGESKSEAYRRVRELYPHVATEAAIMMNVRRTERRVFLSVRGCELFSARLAALGLPDPQFLVEVAANAWPPLPDRERRGPGGQFRRCACGRAPIRYRIEGACVCELCRADALTAGPTSGQ